jgi:hypothetical protein
MAYFRLVDELTQEAAARAPRRQAAAPATEADLRAFFKRRSKRGS